MNSNNPTTLISLLGTEPSFQKIRDNIVSNEATPLFVKDLAKQLDCVKSISPMINNFKNELNLISQNFGLGNKFDSTIQVVAEEMNLVLPGQAPQNSLEEKVQLRTKNNLGIKF